MKTETQHGAEQKLLLALLGRGNEAQDTAEILALLRQVNWPRFLSNTSEDLYPYLAFALEPHIYLLEDPPDSECLSKARRLTAVQNLLLRHELGKALKALSQSGIPALALKGVVMAYTAYPDPSLRPMADLDLLVPPGKREKALQVLRKLGYECPKRAFFARPDPDSRLGPNQEFAPPLQLGASNVFLEIHSQLDCSESLFPISAREVWSRSVVIDLKGLTVRTLCPEDFLFHLCLHLSRSHRFEKGLLPLVDLRLLLDSRSDWNWTGIAERSLRCGCATWMYLTLEVARKLIGAPVPNIFFEALPEPCDPSKLRSLVEAQIWSARSGQSEIPRFLPYLLSECSWQSRARIIRSRVRLARQEDLDAEKNTAKLAQGTRLYLLRLFATIRNKIPIYVHALKRGSLKVGTIRQKALVLRGSKIMFQLIEQETGSVDRNSLPESTSPGTIGPTPGPTAVRR